MPWSQMVLTTTGELIVPINGVSSVVRYEVSSCRVDALRGALESGKLR